MYSKRQTKVCAIVLLIFFSMMFIPMTAFANESTAATGETASTIYYGGTIITVNEKQPTAEAVLVKDGRIAAVGSEKEIMAQKTVQTKLVDLEGQTMLPGFVDAHGHMVGSQNVPRFSPPPVGDVDTLEKLIKAVKAEFDANPPKEGEWFVGGGYDNAFFKNSAHPTKTDLDKISKDVPILLTHVSGHVGAVNSKALEILNITKNTPNPEGGVFVKDANGEPTGVLEETALFQASAVGQKLTMEKRVENLMKAQRYYAQNGITTTVDGAAGPATIDVIKACQEQGDMLVDILVFFMAGNDASYKALENVDSRNPQYTNHFKQAGLKLILDGSPQAKTAWFTKPYYVVPDGQPADYNGYPAYADDSVVLEYFKTCLENNWQIQVHCNGDAAVDQFIRVYRQAQQKTGITKEVKDLRPVIIHAQTIRSDQLDQLNGLGMIPSFFHDHTFYWGDYHLSSVLGPERGNRISPLQEALDKKILFTMHQDSPIVPPNMIFTIHNAVNRVTREGQPIGQQYAVDVMDAIRAVTINSAYQHFEENIKGSIETGKYADFVILDKNPLTVDRTEIKDIKVMETIKEDRSIYKATNESA